MRRAASPLAEVALKWSWDQWISCGWGNWWLTRPGLQQERDAEAYASWLALGEAAILRVLSHNAGQIFIYLPAESPAGEPKRHMGTHDNQEIEQLLQTAQKHETFAAWDHAAAAYAQALALRSDDARLHSRYGAIREELGRRDEAERSYQAARTADPGNPDTRYNLGMFYRERGRAAEAITELRAFLASGPQREAATEVMDTLAELGAPTQLCGNCGCVSPLTKLFHALWGAGVLCPRCYIKHTQGQQRKLTLAIALAVGGLALFTLLLTWAGFEPPYLPGNVLFIVLATYVSVVGHEFAHALAAWLTGGRVYEIRFGNGPDWGKLRLGSLLVRIRALPGRRKLCSHLSSRPPITLACGHAAGRRDDLPPTRDRTLPARLPAYATGSPPGPPASRRLRPCWKSRIRPSGVWLCYAGPRLCSCCLAVVSACLAGIIQPLAAFTT